MDLLNFEVILICRLLVLMMSYSFYIDKNNSPTPGNWSLCAEIICLMLFMSVTDRERTHIKASSPKDDNFSAV